MARSRLLAAGLTALLGMNLLSGVAQAAPETDTARQPVVGKPDLGWNGCARIDQKLPAYSDWPRVRSGITGDAAVERRAAALLKDMTLAEKVGQMTQPEIAAITPEEVRQYSIGTVLNGG